MQQDLLSQLRDIRGIDSVSWWPLAPGWWILAGALVLIYGLYFLLRRHKEKKDLSWQAEVKTRLKSIRQLDTSKEKIAEFSELLRHSAIKLYGRESCAGLEGVDWLSWLSEKDPQGFDWVKNAKLLISAPYAPAAKVTNDDLDRILDAFERWVS